MSRIAVLGAGGHAKVVVATLLASGRSAVLVFDDGEHRWGTTLLGCRIVGALRESEGLPSVIAIGDNDARHRIAFELRREYVAVVHPQACVHESVRIGAGTVVFAGAVVQPDTVLGEHVIVNTGACIDHDCVLGDYAHIAPRCGLAGGVTIGAGAFLGVGCSVIPGVSVAPGIVVGAGSVVVDDLEEPGTYVGAPARKLFPIS